MLTNHNKVSTLDYGDIIYLKINNNILYSNGFYDPSLYLINADKFTHINYRNCLFRITPYISNFYEEYQAKVNQSNENSANSTNPANSENPINSENSAKPENSKNSAKLENHTNSENSAKLENSENSAKPENLANSAKPENPINSENSANLLNTQVPSNTKWENEISKRVRKETIEEAYGNPVKYGDKIQLLHLESQEFIVRENEHEQNDPDLLLNKVSKSITDSWFIMISPNEQENEPILSDKIIQIITGEDPQFILNQGPKIDQNQKFSLEKYSLLNNQDYNSANNVINFVNQRQNTLIEAKEVFSVGLKHYIPGENDHFVTCIIYSKYKDEQSAKINKILRNGDYIRIKNDTNYLGYIQDNENSHFCFHNHVTYDYHYNYTYSIFQLIDITTNNIPIANIIHALPTKKNQDHINEKYQRVIQHDIIDEINKIYILKHVITGKLVKAILNDNNNNMIFETICIDNFFTKSIPIKENSTFRIKFINNMDFEMFLGKSQNKFVMNNTKKINTEYFYGPKFPNQSIDKLIGLEKFPFCIMSINNMENIQYIMRNDSKEPSILNVQSSKDQIQFSKLNEASEVNQPLKITLEQYNPKFCELSFEFIAQHELYYINQLESFRNLLEKVLKILILDDKIDFFTFEKVFKETTDACNVIFHHPFESDINHHIDKNSRIQDLKMLKQILMRELGIFTLIYNILIYSLIKFQKSKENMEINDKNLSLSSSKFMNYEVKYIKKDNIQTESLDLLLKLLINLCKVIRHSISDTNNKVLSAYLLRILFNIYFNDGYNERLKNPELKTELLNCCKRIMWIENPNVIIQVEYYAEIIFNHLISPDINKEINILKIIRNIFRNKYPSNLNKLKILFDKCLINNDRLFDNFAPCIIMNNSKLFFEFFGMNPNSKFRLSIEEIQLGDNKNYLNYIYQWFKILIILIEKSESTIINKIAMHYPAEYLLDLLDYDSEIISFKLKILIISFMLNIYVSNIRTNMEFIAKSPNLYFKNKDYKAKLVQNLTIIDERSNIYKKTVPDFYKQDINEFLAKIKIYDLIEMILRENNKRLTFVNHTKKQTKVGYQFKLEKSKTITTKMREEQLNNILTSLQKNNNNNTNTKNTNKTNNEQTKEKIKIMPNSILLISSLIDFLGIIDKTCAYYKLEKLILYSYTLCVGYFNFASNKILNNCASNKLNQAILDYITKFKTRLIQYRFLGLVNDIEGHEDINIEYKQDDPHEKSHQFKLFKLNLLHEAEKFYDLARSKKHTLALQNMINDITTQSLYSDNEQLQSLLIGRNNHNEDKDSDDDDDNDDNDNESICSISSKIVNIISFIDIFELPSLLSYFQYMVNISQRYYDEYIKIILINNDKDYQALVKCCECYKNIMNLRNKLIISLHEEPYNKNSLNSMNLVHDLIQELLYCLTSVFEIIYDIDKHFEPNNSNDIANMDTNVNVKARFWEIFKNVNYMHIPFKINPNAVNYKYQKMIYATHLVILIIGILKTILFLQQGLDINNNNEIRSINQNDNEKFNQELTILIKLINTILLLFIYKNELNKRLIAQNPTFIEISTVIAVNFDSNFSDFLIIFFEVMRTNEPIMENISRYITDSMIANYTEFLNKINDKDLLQINYPILALLSGFHFIFKEYKKREDGSQQISYIMNLLMKNFIKNDYLNIINIINEEKNNRNIKNNNRYSQDSEVSMIYSPKSFWYVKIFLQEMRHIVENDIYNTEILKNSIDAKLWLILLLYNDGITINFDIKNDILKTIRKIYYNKNIKSTFISNFKEFVVCISLTYWDIIYYLLYMIKKSTKRTVNESEIQKIKQFLQSNLKSITFTKNATSKNNNSNANIVNYDEYDAMLMNKLKKMCKMYENLLENYDFETIILSIDYQNISFMTSWETYIFDNCFGFLLDLMIFDGDYFVRYFEDPLILKNDQIHFQNFLKITIDLIKLLTTSIAHKSQTYPYLLEKCENLKKLGFLAEYTSYKDDINVLYTLLMKKVNSNSKQENIITTFYNINGVENNNLWEKILHGLENYARNTTPKYLTRLTKNILKNKRNIQNLIQYLNFNSEKNPHIIFVLKILRRMIEIFNKLYTYTPIHLWEHLSESASMDIGQIQRTFQEYGLSKVLFNLLKNCKDDNIFYEGCLLAVAFMYNGNRKIQQEFYQLCIKEHTNTIFKKLSDLLKRNIENIKDSTIYAFKHVEETTYDNLKMMSNKSMTLPAASSSSSTSPFISSSFSSSSSPSSPSSSLNDKDKNNNNNESIENLKIILSTLETFCYGEYQEFQQFLKNQITIGYTHPKSFNFLEYIKDFCSHMHNILNHHTIDIGIFSFDTLFELTNGDVNGNIQDLIKDKNFVEGVSKLLSDFDDNYNKAFRGFSKEMNEMQFIKLKTKIIVLFKNITENSDSNDIAHLSKYLNIDGMLEFQISQISEFVTKKEQTHSLRKKVVYLKKDATFGPYHYKPHNYIHKLIYAFDNLTSKDCFIDPFPNIINIYFILRYLWPDEDEFYEYIRDEILEIKKNQEELFLELTLKQQIIVETFFRIFPKLTANVEINLQNRQKSVIKIWFPKLPFCDYLTNESKLAFIGDVDRTNSQTKLLGLLNSVEIFNSQMISEDKSKHNTLGLSYLQCYRYLVGLANSIALALVILNIATLVIPGPIMPDLTKPVPNDKSHTLESDRINSSVYALASIQLAIACIFVFINLWFYRKDRVSIKWVEHVIYIRQKYGRPSFHTENKIAKGKYELLKADEVKEILDFYGPFSPEFIKIKANKMLYKKIRLNYWALELLFSFMSKELTWDVLFLIICGFSLGHHVAIPFQCLDLAIRSYTVRRIVQALFKNASQLLWTAILLIIFVLIYSLFTFSFFNKEFKADAAGYLCTDAFQCFWMVFDLALRAGGGIGAVMKVPPYDRSNNVSLLISRVFFDLTFFIFVITITLHIIFGMMVDAFRELRQIQVKHEEDQENCCFICGLERSEYEKYGNFKEHLEEEHSIWNYIYYIIYLKEKNKHAIHEMTEIESDIHKKYYNKVCDWFPYGTSTKYEKMIEMKHGSKNEENKDDELKGVFEAIHELKSGINKLNKTKKLMIEIIEEQKKEIEMKERLKLEESKKRLAKFKKALNGKNVKMD